MWLLGLIAGLVIGSVIDGVTHGWVATPLLGVAGLFLGIMRSRNDKPVEATTETAEQIRSLRARVVQLELDVAHLKSTAGLTDAAAAAAPVTHDTPGPETAAAVSSHSAPPTENILKTDIYRKTANEDSGPEATPTDPLGAWLTGGNPLARIGALLLFFGVASALKLAIDYGWISPAVRVVFAAVTGAVLVLVGMRKAAEADQARAAVGLALEGLGFGAMYLATYFALAWYHLIIASAALSLFLIISAVCGVMAVRQRSEALAFMGLGGGFIAPLLASTGPGSHIMLFTLYTGLDMAVLALCAGMGWRRLPLAALAFTLGIGMLWAERWFEPASMVSTQVFIAIFAAMFSVMPLLAPMADDDGKPDAERWALALATPAAVLFAQWAMLARVHADDTHYLGSALVLGAWYAGLSMAPGVAGTALRTFHRALAGAWLTTAVPYAFEVTATAMLWLIEGATLAIVGVRRRLTFLFRAGTLLQFGAAVYFVTAAFARARGIDITAIHLHVVAVFVLTLATVHVVLRADGSWMPQENQTVLTCLMNAAGVGLTWLGLVAAHQFEMRPSSPPPLLEAHIAQGVLTMSWAIAALATMIVATGSQARHQWMTGIWLLALAGVKLVLFDVADKGTVAWTASLLGVGALMLAAGWFSPVPPKETVSRP